MINTEDHMWRREERRTKGVLSQVTDIAKAIITDPLGFVAGVMSFLKDMIVQLFETIGQAILDGLNFLGQKIWEGLNFSIGAQWKSRIYNVDKKILEMTEGMTDAQKKLTYLNIKLKY